MYIFRNLYYIPKNFGETCWPVIGGVSGSTSGHLQLMFNIEKHDTTKMHFLQEYLRPESTKLAV